MNTSHTYLCLRQEGGKDTETYTLLMRGGQNLWFLKSQTEVSRFGGRCFDPLNHSPDISICSVQYKMCQVLDISYLLQNQKKIIPVITILIPCWNDLSDIFGKKISKNWSWWLTPKTAEGAIVSL